MAEKFEKVSGNIYRQGDCFYYRNQVQGRRKWHRLYASTVSDAVKEARERVFETANPSPTIHWCLDFYVNDHCPKRNERPREGRYLEEELIRVRRLKEFFGRMRADQLSHSRLREYRRWRGETRACELDIITLSCAMRWAYRNPDESGLAVNPMPTDRPKIAPVKHHCRDKQPMGAEHLHLVANAMLESKRGKVFGHLILFLAFTGLRLSRALSFRTDATNRAAGHYDGEVIWCGVNTNHKGVFPYIEMHDAMKWWHERFIPWRKKAGGFPWYFPALTNNTAHVQPRTVGNSLRFYCQKVGVPHISPHGLRSYYVNVLRSQGVNDHEIALRIGHRSGIRLIVDVYGEITPHKLTFMPEKRSDAVISRIL